MAVLDTTKFITPVEFKEQLKTYIWKNVLKLNEQNKSESIETTLNKDLKIEDAYKVLEPQLNHCYTQGMCLIYNQAPIDIANFQIMQQEHENGVNYFHQFNLHDRFYLWLRQSDHGEKDVENEIVKNKLNGILQERYDFMRKQKI